MNKIYYKHNLGDLVTTKQFNRTLPLSYGVIVQRQSENATIRMYKVHWTDSGLDNRWVFENNLQAVQKVDNEV